MTGVVTRCLKSQAIDRCVEWLFTDIAFTGRSRIYPTLRGQRGLERGQPRLRFG